MIQEKISFPLYYLGNNSVSIFILLKKVGGGLKFVLYFNLFFSNHMLNLNMLLDKEYFF